MASNWVFYDITGPVLREDMDLRERVDALQAYAEKLQGYILTLTEQLRYSLENMDAGRITYGTMDADRVSVRDAFRIYDKDELRGYLGGGTGDADGQTTRGIVMASASGKQYVIVTDAGARMTAGDASVYAAGDTARMEAGAEYIYAAGSGLHASSQIAVDSDRRMKRDIDYDMEQYEAVWEAMRPCAYKMAGDDIHWGYIAQDAAEIPGIDKTALLTQSGDMMQIRYTELIALQDHMIRDLRERVRRLEAKR